MYQDHLLSDLGVISLAILTGIISYKIGKRNGERELNKCYIIRADVSNEIYEQFHKNSKKES